MKAPILIPWNEEPTFIDGGDSSRPSYRLALPSPPPPLVFGAPYGPLDVARETIDAVRHRFRHDGLGFDGVVYGDKERILPMLNRAAEAILFLIWCVQFGLGKVVPTDGRRGGK